MNKKNRTLGTAALFLALAYLAPQPLAHAQIFELLHSYPSQNGGNDNPLIKGTDGNVYGLVFINNGPDGSLVRVDSNGNVTNLVYLKGVYGSSLVQGSDGSFYCTGNQVFRVSPDGTVTTLSTNRPAPSALVQGSDGNFYGTTSGGGDLSLNNGYGFGTVFRMTPSGSLTTLVQFEGANDGGHPGALIQGGDGSFYGLTSINEGGYFSDTFFRATTNGSLTTLDSWSQVFASTVFINPGPDTLMFGSDGNLYGTSFFGDSGLGSVVKVTPDGTMTKLVDFEGNNGEHPGAALLLAHDGNFYGTTLEGGASFGNPNALNGEGYGTVFQMTPDGILTSIHSFGGSDGQSPEIALVEGPDGNLYGTTYFGTQAITGPGMLFRIVMGPPALRIIPSGNTALITWPASAASDILEMSDALSTANWAHVPIAPVQVGDQMAVTVNMDSQSKFFRLRQQ
jgi:uncharacterized repeat protein (TIGR03803 family)